MTCQGQCSVFKNKNTLLCVWGEGWFQMLLNDLTHPTITMI